MMDKLRNNEEGFSATEGVLIVVVVVILGVVGWFVYDRNHNKTTSASTTITPAPTTTPTVNKYAGWKTYTTKNEKLTFKYPSSWVLKDESGNKKVYDSNGDLSTTYNGDHVTLTSKGGLALLIRTGAFTPYDDHSLKNLMTIKGITFLGKQVEWTFWGGDTADSHDGNDNLFSTAILSGVGSDLTGKNAPKSTQSGTIGIDAAFHYENSTGTTVRKTLESVLADQDYKDAQLIIQSMKY